ncbi:MAG TPA: magnesium/cobalt transporter CorA [Anaerolineales bacterium]|nr:magnesium/cobalt transporter CorA [Anaerolineales bacterium]
MIRSLYRNADGTLETGVLPKDFATALADPSGLLWVDFEGETPEVCEPILRESFKFHPLAIDDALQETHVPKLDDWGQYLYLALHAVHYDSLEDDKVDTRELDIFLGENYLVSHHDNPLPAISRAWDRCQKDDRLTSAGADHLAYILADELVVAYMNVFETLDDALDSLEGQIFDKPAPETLSSIFVIKRNILTLRRTLAPQREVLNKLARDNFDAIDPIQRVYFRDIYDHLVRLYDINESMRDQASGSLDTYLSVINNRMNDIMKTLTVITTLFMPISFVASFFGMNFFGPSVPLPGWTSLPALVLSLGAVVITPLVMYSWVRRRGWM